MRISWITGAQALAERLVKDQIDATVPEAGMPPYMESFLAHLRLLVGVPFDYLVPDARLLPNESIRLDNVKSDPDYVKIQQLVIIKTSALNGSAYCMSHNVPLARKIGLTQAQIEAAQGSDYMSSRVLDERQKAAIRWAEAVTVMQARDDDAAFSAMRKHFSEKEIVELTVFCGMWNYSNRLCEALHVDLERPEQRIAFQER